MRAALAVLSCAACAGSPRVLARGVLAYDVAAAGDLVATLELETRFELVLRRPGGVVRVALGPPEYDMVNVALDGAGRVAAVAGRDATVRLHDAASGRETARWRLDAAATAVALSADGAWLVTGAASGVLCLRRVADGALLQCVAAHDRPIRALLLRGDLLTSLDDGGATIAWRLPALAIAGRGRLDGTTAVALTPDGRLVRAYADGRVELDGRQVARFPGPARGLSVAPDGKTLYIAGFTTRDLAGPSLVAVRL